MAWSTRRLTGRDSARRCAGMRKPVSTQVARARRLVEHHGSHPLISLYLDLDPERFATPPARASQIHSLLDQAHRDIEDQVTFRTTSGSPCARTSSDSGLSCPRHRPPFKGARALAVFCCSRDDLFEALQLSRPVEGQVVIERAPYVEPMLSAVEQRRWLVALVSRGSARILTGYPAGCGRGSRQGQRPRPTPPGRLVASQLRAQRRERRGRPPPPRR